MTQSQVGEWKEKAQKLQTGAEALSKRVVRSGAGTCGGYERVSNEGVLIVADREEGNIKNYAGPKILLESLYFHGDFAPGGGDGGGVDGGGISLRLVAPGCVGVFWLGG